MTEGSGALERITRSGALALQENMTRSQWLALGKRLARIPDLIQWQLGDWWNYGEHHYGEGTAASVVIGIEPATLREYARVAARFAPDQRRPELSWTHHRLLAGLEDPTELLATAADNEWSVADLREVIRRPETSAESAIQNRALTPPEQGEHAKTDANRGTAIPARESAHRERESGPKARPTPTQPKRIIEASANEAPTARTLAAELAGQAAMAWDAIPPEHIRALGAHIDAQKSKRGMGEVTVEGSDAHRLVAGVRAWAQSGRIDFSVAVERVLGRLQSVSGSARPGRQSATNGSKPYERETVIPMFKGGKK